MIVGLMQREVTIGQEAQACQSSISLFLSAKALIFFNTSTSLSNDSL